jgi:hypothetical protein
MEGDIKWIYDERTATLTGASTIGFAGRRNPDPISNIITSYICRLNGVFSCS